jgi:hypothetical protein
MVIVYAAGYSPPRHFSSTGIQTVPIFFQPFDSQGIYPPPLFQRVKRCQHGHSFLFNRSKYGSSPGNGADPLHLDTSPAAYFPGHQTGSVTFGE